MQANQRFIPNPSPRICLFTANTGLTKAQASEEPMRNLYGRWAQFMEADSWDALMTWRRNAPREARAAE